MKYNGYTPELVKKVQESKEAGKSIQKTAKELGVGRDVIISCWNGSPRDRRRREFSDEEKYTAQELYKQGYTVSQIAMEFGIGWMAARHLLDSLCLYD